MNISKPLILVSTTILLLIFSNTSFGQKLEPKIWTLEPDHILNSEIMEKDYQLYISFPSNYSTNDTISYPVLYVLDGSFYFQSFQSAQKHLNLYGEIEHVIIVGIGSGLDLKSYLTNRNYDYTPSRDSISDEDYERNIIGQKVQWALEVLLNF